MTLRRRILLFFAICVLLALAVPVDGAEACTGSIRVAAGRMTLYRVDGGDLQNWSDPTAARALADYVQTNGIPGVTRTADETGHVVFGGLQPGLYLLMGPGDIPPFLVPIPMKVGEQLYYEIQAAPKTAPSHPDTGQPVGLLPWTLAAAAAGLGLSLVLRRKTA